MNHCLKMIDRLTFWAQNNAQGQAAYWVVDWRAPTTASTNPYYPLAPILIVVLNTNLIVKKKHTKHHQYAENSLSLTFPCFAIQLGRPWNFWGKGAVYTGSELQSTRLAGWRVQAKKKERSSSIIHGILA